MLTQSYKTTRTHSSCLKFTYLIRQNFVEKIYGICQGWQNFAEWNFHPAKFCPIRYGVILSERDIGESNDEYDR